MLVVISPSSLLHPVSLTHFPFIPPYDLITSFHLPFFPLSTWIHHLIWVGKSITCDPCPDVMLQTFSDRSALTFRSLTCFHPPPSFYSQLWLATLTLRFHVKIISHVPWRMDQLFILGDQVRKVLRKKDCVEENIWLTYPEMDGLMKEVSQTESSEDRITFCEQRCQKVFSIKRGERSESQVEEHFANDRQEWTVHSRSRANSTSLWATQNASYFLLSFSPSQSHDDGKDQDPFPSSSCSMGGGQSESMVDL